MSEHISEDVVERYRERKLSPRELLTTDDHLATCHACRSKVSREERLREAFVSLRADLESAPQGYEHPPYEELARYVDRKLDDVDREIVQSHLALCPECEAEARDLEALKTKLESTTDRPRALHTWIPLQILGTAAATVLLAWVATTPLRSDLATTKREVETLRSENERLRQDEAAARSQVRALEARLADPGRAVPAGVTLRDGGGVLTLDASGRLSGVEGLPEATRQAVATALSIARVEAPPLVAGLIEQAGTLRGGGEGVSFALVSPVGTVVVTDRPTFQWRPLGAATGYRVAVFDTRFNKIAESPTVSGAEWTVPRPLPRGATYTWQVTADTAQGAVLSPRPPAPQARFHVLDREKAQALGRAANAYSRSHLVLGILYAKAGALDDAERELRALVDANPGSLAPLRLLQNVEALRRPR